MNDNVVGVENLPNVYIQKIEVEEGRLHYTMIVQIGMYDHKESPSWRRDEMANLKVRVYATENQQEIEGLNSGNMSIQDLNSGKVFKAIDLIPANISGDYENYVGTVQFRANKPNQNLNIYSACYIDELNFGIDAFDKFCGPLVGEAVISSGVINPTSNYFYYPDTNEEYAGPVHAKPDGSYMEGSQHSSQPHKSLSIVVEENHKIQMIGRLLI